MVNNQLLGIVLLSAAVMGAHVDKCKDARISKDGFYGSAIIHDIRVSNCPDSPCNLKKGGSVVVEFDFMPDKPYNQLTTSVFGGIGILRVPFRDVHGKNACKDIYRKRDGKPGCPLMPNEVYTYSTSFPILPSYPSVNVAVQYGLNYNKAPVVCFTLPAKIVN